MSSRRTTRDNNKVRVATIFLNVGFNPGNGLFDVDDLGGISVPGREPIINRHTNPAHFNHAVQEWLSLMRLVAHHPGAAMHMQQYRSALSLGHRGVDVQQPPLSRGGIAHIAHIAHTGTTETKRPKPLLAMNLLCQLGPPCLGNVTQKIRAQRCAQGALERRTGIEAILKRPPK